MPSTKLVHSLQRGFRVLEAFTATKPHLSLSQVVEITKMPKATALRFLRSLVELNYVCYDRDAKLYSLSVRAMSLGFIALSGIDLREVAFPFMEELFVSTGQSVSLAIQDGLEIVCIERLNRRRIVNIDMRVGSHFNIYQTSLGQAILAYMGEAERNRIIKDLLGDLKTAPILGPDGNLLTRRLEEVVRRGYALDDQDLTVGLRAIAAPIFNNENKVEGAINIAVFASLVSCDELIERYAKPLMDTAQQISLARGFGNQARLEAKPNSPL